MAAWPASRASRRIVTVAAAIGVLVTFGGCGRGADAVTPDGDNRVTAAALSGTPSAVGPVTITIPTLADGEAAAWYVQPTQAGVTQVDVTSCQEGAPCPSFTVTTGAAITDGFDGSQAWLPPDATCPGSGALVAAQGDVIIREDVTIGGKSASYAEFELTCTGADDDASVTQRQWYVAGSPVGAVVIVDRWSIDTLADRIAAATWN